MFRQSLATGFCKNPAPAEAWHLVSTGVFPVDYGTGLSLLGPCRLGLTTFGPRRISPPGFQALARIKFRRDGCSAGHRFVACVGWRGRVGFQETGFRLARGSTANSPSTHRNTPVWAGCVIFGELRCVLIEETAPSAGGTCWGPSFQSDASGGRASGSGSTSNAASYRSSRPAWLRGNSLSFWHVSNFEPPASGNWRRMLVA